MNPGGLATCCQGGSLFNKADQMNNTFGSKKGIRDRIAILQDCGLRKLGYLIQILVYVNKFYGLTCMYARVCRVQIKL